MDMVVQFKKYAQELRHKIEPYFAEKQPEVSPYRCCLSLGNKRIKLVLTKESQDVTEICLVETLQYEDIESLALVLMGIVKKHQLELTPTYWLLSPDDYQLFLIDSLAVEKDEFRSALNWRLRNLISYPVNEASIDYFTFPPKKTGSTNPIIGAVAAKMEQLGAVIDIFKKANLNLTVIDIPELALRNLTARFENDEKSTALIYFYDNMAILNISHQKSLYFTRHINLSVAAETKVQDYEQLSLEIVRYFDYFQSQWRLANPTRIFVASDHGSIHETANMLAKHLMMPVEVITLGSMLMDQHKTTIEKHYLLEFGTTLRKDDLDGKAGN